MTSCVTYISNPSVSKQTVFGSFIKCFVYNKEDILGSETKSHSLYEIVKGPKPIC